MSFRIAIVSSPWIGLPPGRYGGVEATIVSLARKLARGGHRVDVVTVGASSLDEVKIHALHADGQYDRIFRPLYDNVAIPLAHLTFARRVIKECGPFDVVHDHNFLLGPAVLATADEIPPVLHTVHGPFLAEDTSDVSANDAFYTLISRQPGLWFNGISNAQLAHAPAQLRPRILGVAHNGLDFAEIPLHTGPRPAFLSMGRFSPEKGHDTAIRLCAEVGAPLWLAGSVGGLHTPQAVYQALADESSPHWQNRELAYFNEQIRPYLSAGHATYLGPVSGADRYRLLGEARALLMPIEWEEPFGMVAIEAMACGTPVVAYARGALPEIVDEGVTGFLASNEADLRAVLGRAMEIDPVRCRDAAAARFSAEIMTERYLTFYREVMEKSQRA